MEIIVKNDDKKIVMKTSDGNTCNALLTILSNIRAGQSFCLDYKCSKTYDNEFKHLEISRTDTFKFKY